MDSKRVLISSLLDIYGALLKDGQRDVLDLYYNGDLSLSEIGEDTGITRQGVRDALKKGEAKLLEFEEKLCFYKKSQKLRSGLEEVAEQARQAGNERLCALAADLTAEL
ncbi:MAG: DNA-binding protein [Clostridia bacterium]|nr:DNA-binding protein [Clostridia bacterium]